MHRPGHGLDSAKRWHADLHAPSGRAGGQLLQGKTHGGGRDLPGQGLALLGRCPLPSRAGPVLRADSSSCCHGPRLAPPTTGPARPCQELTTASIDVAPARPRREQLVAAWRSWSGTPASRAAGTGGVSRSQQHRAAVRPLVRGGSVASRLGSTGPTGPWTPWPRPHAPGSTGRLFGAA